MLKTKIEVPCGRCPQCRKRRASAWSFRLIQEDKVSISSQFITLTYAPKFLPHSRNNFRTLNPEHLQLFFKRLRAAHTTRKLQFDNKGRVYSYILPLKYYAVGEYGGMFKRPHYHIILFNADPELIEQAWSIYSKRHRAYIKVGSVHFGNVSAKSVGYVLKYISDVTWKPRHINDDRTPQFSRMSKGLGESYLTPAMCHWHKSKLLDRMYCNIEGGKKSQLTLLKEELELKFDFEISKKDVKDLLKILTFGAKEDNKANNSKAQISRCEARRG